MSQIERGKTQPESTEEFADRLVEMLAAGREAEIGEMIKTGRGLERWNPTTVNELHSLLSDERIPLNIAFEIASKKLDQIVPEADADTLNILVQAAA